MFVRRLVSGVRNSCDASETSRRCASDRLLERGEHRVEGNGEAPELVLAVRVHAAAQVLRRGDVLGGLRQPAGGHERGLRDAEAEQRRQPAAAERDGEQDPAQPVEHVVHLCQRTGDLEGEPRRPRRDDGDPYVRARDGGVPEKRAALAERDLHRALVHRQLEREAGLANVLPSAATSCK